MGLAVNSPLPRKVAVYAELIEEPKSGFDAMPFFIPSDASPVPLSYFGKIHLDA
jgi:hypothetical protein